MEEKQGIVKNKERGEWEVRSMEEINRKKKRVEQ